MKKQLFIFFTAALLVFAFHFSADAATISKVNTTQALVDLEGESTQVGAEFFALNASGKRVALLSVKRVQGGKALMLIKKGKASAGDSLQARKAMGKSTRKSNVEDSSESSDVGFRTRSDLAGGVLLGYAMNSMSMTVQVGTTTAPVSMTDSSFSFKGFVDYDLSPTVTVRAASGYETFSVKGSIDQALCDGTTSCKASFSYIPFEGSAHYNFMTGNTKAWVGLGYSFLMELGRSVNIPNLAGSGKTNQIIFFSAGADFKSGKSSFIPLVLEYGSFPGSSSVKASAIYLRTGYGFAF